MDNHFVSLTTVRYALCPPNSPGPDRGQGRQSWNQRFLSFFRNLLKMEPHGQARACTPKCLPLPKRFVPVFRHAGVVPKNHTHLRPWAL